MIELNLLPDEIKRKRRKTKITIPVELIFGIGGLFVCLLIIFHIMLAGTLFAKKMRYSQLSKAWDKIQPDKIRIDKLKEETSLLENRIKYVEQLTANRINWSEKLNRISDLIPRGVWLSSLVFDDPTLKLEGSAVSKQKEEMILVGQFTSGLKKDPKISADFKDIEVRSIQRRKIKTLEVVDFVMTANLKEGKP